MLELMAKIENCPFECEAGDLRLCEDWIDLKAEITRLTAVLAEREGEIERLRKVTIQLGYEGSVYPFQFAECTIVDYGHSDNIYIVNCPEIQTKLKQLESLAASRLADQEAIERHVTKRVVRECAEIAEAMWSDHYWAWPAMQTYADKIRKKYGVE